MSLKILDIRKERLSDSLLIQLLGNFKVAACQGWQILL